LKNHNELHFLVGVKMLNVIDYRLWSIKHIHVLFWDLDVIMTKDFYQTPPMQDAWIIKKSSKSKLMY
jgi:hypothetical protein